MFTIAQISSIIALLLAFNVPQAQVDTVRTILTKTTQEVPATGSIGSAATTSQKIVISHVKTSVVKSQSQKIASVKITWETNVPTVSTISLIRSGIYAVYITPDGQNTHEVRLQASGDSTQITPEGESVESTLHSVELSEMQADSRYSYTIDANAGSKKARITGFVDTN